MERLVQLGVETERGLRSIELFSGDITDVPFALDVLCVSAFPGEYFPLVGTTLGALHSKWSMSIQDLRDDCWLDLTVKLHVWISAELSHPNVRRLLCVDIPDDRSGLREAFENLFVGISVLEAKGYPVQVVAMPLLGAGNIGLPANEVADLLVPLAERAVKRSASIERLIFIEIDRGRAAALSDAIDLHLGRSRVLLPRRPLIDGLRRDILSELQGGESFVPMGHIRLVDEIKLALNQQTIRASELGVLSRRVVEFVVNDILGESKTSPDLLTRIEKLSGKGVASWIQSYMHLLRVLGNESAHEKSTTGVVPPIVDKSDLTICLFCLHRIWRFWLDWRKLNPMQDLSPKA
jgi:hypothetical protein